MVYITYYKSPLGKILLASKNNKLIGLWFENQKYYLENLHCDTIQKDNEEIFIKTKDWLDRYFKGNQPSIKEIDLAPIGSDFRQNVWSILCDISYGNITTYGEIASKIENKMNKKNMSAQAIGGAVGHNPISIIIPCHRVVGKNGNLTGYAGGIDKKIKLLELENVNITNLSIPLKNTVLC